MMYTDVRKKKHAVLPSVRPIRHTFRKHSNLSLFDCIQKKGPIYLHVYLLDSTGLSYFNVLPFHDIRRKMMKKIEAL